MEFAINKNSYYFMMPKIKAKQTFTHYIFYEPINNKKFILNNKQNQTNSLNNCSKQNNAWQELLSRNV